MTIRYAEQAVPDGLLTTTELATIIRRSESTIRYWRTTGTGPRSFKVGRRVMYDAEDVRRFIRESRETVEA